MSDLKLIDLTLRKTFEVLPGGKDMKPKLTLLKPEALHKADERWFPRLARSQDLIEEVADGIFLCRSCDELLPRGDRDCKSCRIEEMGDAGDLEPIA